MKSLKNEDQIDAILKRLDELVIDDPYPAYLAALREWQGSGVTFIMGSLTLWMHALSSEDDGALDAFSKAMGDLGNEN